MVKYFSDHSPIMCKGSAATFLERSLYHAHERKAELKLKRKLNFLKMKAYIKRSCGFRPRIDVEESLKRRIQKTRYRGMLLKSIEVTNQSMDLSLRKAMVSLMSRRAHAISKPRLLNAIVNVFQNIVNRPTISGGKQKMFRPTSLSFAMTLLNKRASSGYPFTGRKGKNYHAIQKMAQRMCDCNLTGQYKYYPNLCGFRLQLRGSAPNIKVKSRIMYPYPAAITAIEQRFLFPVLKHFERLKGHTFYTLGMRGGDVTKWLKSRGRRNKKRILSIDINAWDQNLVNDVIIGAFWIIRKMHVLTEDEIILFQNQMLHSLVSYHAVKYRGLPHLFVKDHGIPSGSSYTNIVGTLCHAIIAEYIDKGILAQNRILICSDDNIFETDLTLAELSTAYLVFGLTISVEKSATFVTWQNVKFLGYIWIDYLRNVDISLCLNQMVFHSQYIVELDAFERELARSASILLSGVNGQQVFRELFPEVISRLNSGENIRFTYLYGSGPPMTNPSVINKLDSKIPDRVSFSLRHHLIYGHLIR